MNDQPNQGPDFGSDPGTSPQTPGGSGPAPAPRPPIDPTGTSTPPPPPPGYVPAVYVQHPGNAGGARKVITYLLVAGLLISFTINVYLFGPVALLLKSLSQTAPPEENFYPTVVEDADDDRIVVVEVSGMIDGSMADYCRKVFYTLEKNPPAGVVLRVESGGGGVTASDQIWNAIKSFRKAHPDVPFVASFGTVAASGGYYISAPADRIFCERTGITGSIGVLAQLPALGGLIEKLGVEMNMVIAKQSPSKDDANNLFITWKADENEPGKEVELNGEKQKLTPEGYKSYMVISNLVDGAYETFFSVVKEGRTKADKSISESDLRKAADGSIFVGEEAKDAKLVDEIGYLEDAIKYVASEAKLGDEPKVKIIRKPIPGFFSSMASRNENGIDLTNFTGQDLRNLFEDATTLRLEYRLHGIR